MARKIEIPTREEIEAIMNSREYKVKTKREQVKNQEIQDLRFLTIRGFNNNEIAQKMNCSIGKIMNLKKLAIERGEWFSKQEIAFFKEQRIKRDDEDKVREQKRIAAEARKNATVNREKRDAKNDLYAEYRDKKRLAKIEDKQEFNGKENVPLDGRRQFADVLVKMFAVGELISEKDINIVLNTIYLHHDFVSKEYLRLLVLNASKLGGLAGAEKMVTTLHKELEDTKFEHDLCEYKKWLKSRKKLVRITQLKKEGLSNGQIAERLNMTSSEVVVLMNSYGQTFDFLKDDER